MDSDDEYSNCGYYESYNVYKDQYTDQFEDQYSDQHSHDDNDDRCVYDSDCGNSDEEVTFQDIRDFDEGLGISDDDNENSEVVYKRQYLDGSSDSESDDVYTNGKC